jgi:flagellin-like protein
MHVRVPPAKRQLLRSAVSSIVATLILIAIAIEGGAFVYVIFYSTAGTASRSLHAVITEATASQTGGVTFTLKNDGSVGISSFGFTITPDIQTTENDACSAELTPGSSAACLFTDAMPSAGYVYSVVVTVAGEGNAGTAVTSITVIATR